MSIRNLQRSLLKSSECLKSSYFIIKLQRLYKQVSYSGNLKAETLQEEPQEKTAEKKEAFAKYTAKDSVFSTLFRDKKYLMQLYRALHPEDAETTEDALTDITIRNVLTNGIFNDRAFRVGDKIRQQKRGVKWGEGMEKEFDKKYETMKKIMDVLEDILCFYQGRGHLSVYVDLDSLAYDDVRYTGKNNAVAGGYLKTYIWDTPGTKNFTI